MLQHDRALGFLIKRKNGVAAEFLHRSAQFATGFERHQIAVKCLSRERPRDRAVRADQPQIKPKLLRDRQSKRMTTAGDQDNFNSRGMSPPQCAQIILGNLELRIEQRTVDISGDQAYGSAQSTWGLMTPRQRRLMHLLIVTQAIS